MGCVLRPIAGAVTDTGTDTGTLLTWLFFMKAYVTDMGGVLLVVAEAAAVAVVVVVVVAAWMFCMNLGADMSLIGGVLMLLWLKDEIGVAGGRVECGANASCGCSMLVAQLSVDSLDMIAFKSELLLLWPIRNRFLLEMSLFFEVLTY